MVVSKEIIHLLQPHTAKEAETEEPTALLFGPFSARAVEAQLHLPEGHSLGQTAAWTSSRNNNKAKGNTDTQISCLHFSLQ